MADTTFTPTGKHLIAGEWVGGSDTFRSAPLTGEGFDVARGTAADVDRAVQAAEDAFWTYGYTSRETRAKFLEAIADEIEARGEAITAIGTAESGLPEARLQGERGRTTGQLPRRREGPPGPSRHRRDRGRCHPCRDQELRHARRHVLPDPGRSA